MADTKTAQALGAGETCHHHRVTKQCFECNPPRDDCTLTDLAAAMLAVEMTLHKHTNNRGPANHARWRRLTPAGHIVDHALNHIRMHLAGDRREPHLAHAATRLLMALQLDPDGRAIAEAVWI